MPKTQLFDDRNSDILTIIIYYFLFFRQIWWVATSTKAVKEHFSLGNYDLRHR